MLVKTPPMGWNTWNTFEKNINEKLILESADAMVENGLKDCGYEYIVIDDIWSLRERDKDGHIVPDPEKFPHGMKYIADYIHSKGLKFGMYADCGFETCAGYPGSYGYEWIDAQDFASWEIDFLKYDFCFHPTSVNADVLYKRMAVALANSGRDILFSACTGGRELTKQWIKETGANMWRSTPDIFDGWESIKKIAQSQTVCPEYNGLNCFNDMDMLVVGMHGKGHVGLKGCTFEEYKLHFSLWAIMGSPLMIGCDIRNMDKETKQILMNKDVIAINQDSDYRQPYSVHREFVPRTTRTPEEPFFTEYHEDGPFMARLLSNGDIAVGFFNMTEHVLEPYWTKITPDLLGIPIDNTKKIVAKDLWSGEIFTLKNNLLEPQEPIQPHCCKLYRLSVQDK